MLKQFLAGFLLESVRKKLNLYNDEEILKVKGLLQSLCSFEATGTIELGTTPGNYHPILAVMHNIITRGIPTIASIQVEEAISTVFAKTKFELDDIVGEFSYPFFDNTLEAVMVFDALHLIDPRLDLINNNYNIDLLESNFEKDFIFQYLDGENKFLRQLLLPQRSFSSIIHPRRASAFVSQRVDLSVESPYLTKFKLTDKYGNSIDSFKRTGYIIEIDGPQHHYTTIEDNNRDIEAKQAFWEPLRIKSNSQKNDVRNALIQLNEDTYLSKCKELYSRPLDDTWSEILQIVLSPIAVCRLQLILIEYLLAHQDLLLKESELKIAIIEQDVPCGQMAVNDLTELASNLKNLSADLFHFPNINVDVFSSKEFIHSPLHKLSKDNRVNRIEDFQIKNHDYVVVLDISILRRSFIEKVNHIDKCIRIRSSHFNDSEIRRIVYTSRSIKYKPVVKKLQNESFETIPESVKPLEFFLSGLFRKISFMEGQLPILNRALKNQSVIGLLPTGGGKSLTYQLASLLQPGLTLVIDPIKSLMQDQYDNLVEAGIDSAIFINSTLTTRERKINTARFESGECMFCFVSPERLIIQEFRDALLGLEKSKTYFSYCVIDEVHCVSEWGHDFRTAYLSLGKNAVDYCKTANGEPVSIFGLTATASFDVLSDVERELSYKGNLDTDAIVRRENTIRDEIQYRILETEGNFEKLIPFRINGLIFNELGPLQTEEYNAFRNKTEMRDVNDWKIKEIIGEDKKEKVRELIEEVPFDIEERFNHINLKKVLEQTFEKFLEEKDIQEFADKLNLTVSESERLKYEFVQYYLDRILYENLDIKNFYDENCMNAGIVFCLHRGWHFGVTDQFKWQKNNENVYDNQGNIKYRKGDYVIDNNGNKVPISFSERKGMADRLYNDEKLKIGTFIGSGGENEREEQKIQQSSFENQEKFIKNKLNLMVATKAFGMGINKRNIRFTIHLNIPNSLEGFIQEGGRAGRDRKMAINYILLNNQKFAVWNNESLNRLIIKNKTENVYNDVQINQLDALLAPIQNKFFFKEDYEKLITSLCSQNGISQPHFIVENAKTIHLDQDFLFYFHNRSFKGQDKEKAILFELRDRITYPNVPRLKILEEFLKEEVMIDELSLNIWDNRRLYFNAGYKNSFGYIDLVNNQMILNEAQGYNISLSGQLLEEALGYILQNYNGINQAAEKARWLSEKQIIDPEAGIERWILNENIPINSRKEFKIHFENLYVDDNDYLHRLRSFWVRIFEDNDIHFNAATIDGCMSEEEDIELYLNNIENEFGSEIIEALLKDNRMDALKIRFYCKRNKEDTDKAVYRMQSIGLIEDYTIDYNAKMYHLKVIKKSPEKYVESLYEFIKRYYSEVKARREVEKIDQSDKHFIIRNCINFLTDFIYREIEKKRKIAIADMQTACEEGLNENNIGFKEFVYLYFNSKFARRIFLVNDEDYSLLSEENTDDGKIQSFEIVWKFIEAVNGKVEGSQIDNLKHLRGATLRILRSNPDNSALNLLKAYALFLLAGQNETLFNEAANSYFKGFIDFREYYSKMHYYEFNKNIEKFKEYTLENTESKKVMEVIDRLTQFLYLKIVANQFHNFKTKFLENYGSKINGNP